MAVQVRDVRVAESDALPIPGPVERPRGERARTVKVTVTVPADVVESARELVRAGHARSLSEYVSKALTAQVATDQGEGGLAQFLAELDAELGPPSEADFAWARAALGL